MGDERVPGVSRIPDRAFYSIVNVRTKKSTCPVSSASASNASRFADTQLKSWEGRMINDAHQRAVPNSDKGPCGHSAHPPLAARSKPNQARRRGHSSGDRETEIALPNIRFVQHIRISSASGVRITLHAFPSGKETTHTFCAFMAVTMASVGFRHGLTSATEYELGVQD